jgi:hypothetical protein
VLYIVLNMNFLWIQPLSDFKKSLQRKHTNVISWEHRPADKSLQNSNQLSRVTQVRNREKMNPLPLMIFIWFHEDFNLFNKCSFCSIVSTSKNLRFVFFSNPRLSYNRQTKYPNCIRQVHRNMSNNVLYSSLRLFLAWIIDNISTGQ